MSVAPLTGALCGSLPSLALQSAFGGLTLYDRFPMAKFTSFPAIPSDQANQRHRASKQCG